MLLENICGANVEPSRCVNKYRYANNVEVVTHSCEVNKLSFEMVYPIQRDK